MSVTLLVFPSELRMVATDQVSRHVPDKRTQAISVPLIGESGGFHVCLTGQNWHMGTSGSKGGWENGYSVFPTFIVEAGKGGWG